MTQKKEEAIQKIMSKFEELANLVLRQLDLLDEHMKSGQFTVPTVLIEQVIENEKELDLKEVELNDRIINSLVLYQPVASEIRKIIACYRIVISLERIGDLVVKSFRFMERIQSKEVYDELSDVIGNMLTLSISMVKNSLISYVSMDKDLAIWTIKNDAVANAMNQKMLQQGLKKGNLPSDGRNVLLSFINIKEMVSSIERIADHAANIAEAAIYSLEGKDIRHRRDRNIQDSEHD